MNNLIDMEARKQSIYNDPTLRQFGLNWMVDTERLITTSGLETGTKALIRINEDGSRSVLGDKLGLKYLPAQNDELVKFAEPFIEAGHLSVNNGHCFDGGNIVSLSFKVAEADIIEGDTLTRYINILNSHNGKHPFGIYFTDIRDICKNTLFAGIAQSEGNDEKRLTMRHTIHMPLAIEEAKMQLDVLNQRFLRQTDLYKQLLDISMNDSQRQNYFAQALTSADDSDKVARRGKALMDQINEIFESAPGQDVGRDTAWSAYNAITHYTSHVRGTAKTTEDDRAYNVQFGSAQAINRQAFDLALALA